MRRLLTIAFLLACSVSFSLAEDVEDEDRIIEPTETAPLVVSVKDEEGKPIAGVVVRPYACRCLEDRGSHYGWPTYNVGPPGAPKTDAEGKVTIMYPVKFGRSPEWNTTCEVSALLSHPEYISERLDEDPRGGTAEATMKAGCQLSFSATDSNGTPVEFGVTMAGPGRNATWSIDENGTRRSRAIPDGSWQTMLVSPGESGKHLFSGVLPIRLRDQQAVNIRNLRLTPGLRLAGKLDDSVPRPVTNGTISVYCLPRPDGRVYADENPSLCWETWTNVNDDGSFEFPSLPRTGLIQLIAVCDTHVVKNVDVIDPNPHFRQGMYLTIDERDDLEDITVPMEPAGTLQVTVLDPEGKPLPNAPVSTWPNQSMHLSGSTILGRKWDAIELIQQQIDSESEPRLRMRRRESRFETKTDEKGVAILKGIPLNKRESLLVYHDEYLMPISDARGDREMSYEITDDQPLQLTVEMMTLESAELDKGVQDIKNALEAAGNALQQAIGK
ncbi:hypothetical protein [Stieleria varia]|uniref:Nickel uptake substrate-specific transmembrane region n=1 Tax=Stieleria varia TaxID=2528005 RepID=A0A5C6AP68_9BACT|nr:hypothetical protein [Stieleria varia]TWU01069.1 hypothetical protein Pla52n_44400 [Stieleria varia]